MVYDPMFLSLVLESEDSHIISTLFYTLYGCYLGYETKKGNYEFKTILNNNKELKRMEENEAMIMCYFAHVGFNPSFYIKERVDELKKEGLDNIIYIS